MAMNVQSFDAAFKYEGGINLLMKLSHPDFKSAELSNHLFPNRAFAMILDGNATIKATGGEHNYKGQMSEYALSLAVNIVLSAILTFELTGEPRDLLADNYYNLLQVAEKHPEAAEIKKYVGETKPGL
jgi:hypothetical protein